MERPAVFAAGTFRKEKTASALENVWPKQDVKYVRAQE